MDAACVHFDILNEATQSNIDREEFRNLRGGFVGQEISFKK